MDSRDEVKAFLRSRRARLTPQDVGLIDHGRRRRVAGLRRIEVAALADISVEYYAELERGKLGNVSDAVLVSLARALRLSQDETDYLTDLIRPSGSIRAGVNRGIDATACDSPLRRMLDRFDGLPAFINNGRLDLIASNRLARVLYAPFLEADCVGANHARFVFLAPQARQFWAEWDHVSRNTVAFLRAESGRSPRDAELQELIRELTLGSEIFRRLWRDHSVQWHTSGVKNYRHPAVGPLRLDFESFAVLADPTLTMTVLCPQPGSQDEESLQVLAGSSTNLDRARL